MEMTNIASNLNDLHAQYDQKIGLFENFCVYLERELREIISSTVVSYFELSWRIKTWDSIEEKIERKALGPKSILEIHDVIGFRIATLFKRDIPIVCDAVRSTLDVVWEDDKANNKPDDVFGYLSVHFQIKPPDRWLCAPSTNTFTGLSAELQIRTFSQHVWAASSHLLQYKIENGIPYQMRRNIYRLAAVLEIVDDELENILTARENYHHASLEKPYQDADKDALETPLDNILLECVLDEFFQGKNKKAHEPYDVLMQELLYFGITTVRQLRELIERGLPAIKKLESKKCESGKESYYTYTGKLRIAMQAVFPEEYKKYVRR